MTTLSYLLSISRAMDAATLHDLRREVDADQELTEVQRESLRKSIGKQFSWLNHEALPVQGRW